MEISGQPWDVNRYRSEFESEEHWQLRKRFMLTHMNKFPEDKLVCLTQVFFNVEFLGCRYPEETMKMIAELSIGVADDHREKQKGKLKRTFVAASDAAGARIKGYDTPTPKEPASKLARLGEDTDVSDSKESEGFCQAHMRFAKPPMKLLPPSGGFPGLILFEIRNNLGELISCPINILNMSVAKNVIWRNIEFSVLGSKCEVKINDKLLASAKGGTAKEAKLNAATKGLEILRRNCYTIQMKQAFYSSDPSITKDVKVGESDDNRLSADNIGSKMMQKMGWAGSGLGKSQQGIQEPIQAASQIFKRQGFGHEDPKEMEKKFSKLFQDYIESDSDNDLVFSPEFSSAERKILHRLAQNLQLKTRSYGKKDERHLVVFRKLRPPDLLNMLLASGGETTKYLLIPPKLGANDDPSMLPNTEEENVAMITSMPGVNQIEQQTAPNTFQAPPNFYQKTNEQDISTVTSTQSLNSRFDSKDKDVITYPETTVSSQVVFTNNVNDRSSLPDVLQPKYDAWCALVDRVLKDKDERLKPLLAQYKNMTASYSNTWSTPQKKKYRKTRRELLWHTGIHIPDLLKDKPGFNPETIIKVLFRKFAAGLALARNSNKIKAMMFHFISNEMNLNELGLTKINKRKVKKAFEKFGKELLLKYDIKYPQYKESNLNCPEYRKLVSTNFLSVKDDPYVLNVLKIDPCNVEVTDEIISFFRQIVSSIDPLQKKKPGYNRWKKINDRRALMKKQNAASMFVEQNERISTSKDDMDDSDDDDDESGMEFSDDENEDDIIQESKKPKIITGLPFNQETGNKPGMFGAVGEKPGTSQQFKSKTGKSKKAKKRRYQSRFFKR